MGRWVGKSVLPRAERFRPRIVRKSSPIGIANSAMPSGLLAMHSCSMLCFRLCHRLIAGGHHTVRCWLRRWLNGLILDGFWGLRSTDIPHYRSRCNRRYGGLCRRRACKGENNCRTCGSTYCTRDQCNQKGATGIAPSIRPLRIVPHRPHTKLQLSDAGRFLRDTHCYGGRPSRLAKRDCRCSVPQERWRAAGFQQFKRAPP